jgi:uncharacterized OB-fold protein
MTQVELPPAGELWTWTVQGFPPPSPPCARAGALETFVPYGVGYIDLDGEVLVEARLTTADPDELRIGCRFELVIVPLATDDDGDDLLTFAFQPCGAEVAP